ncbi:hypothetical protein [Loktanella sp. M215]|uniref:hypothetical protein n=1 Tax=Loktanella sp. M215 TaxID=2675431 RepID=UPI001F451EAE|nr:hypothetical protein [Loktanella sp. M215]MCF7700671.1 hypothetical protein [Loktanella sp. M215]
MASQHPAQSEAENQQQGDTHALPQQTGTPLAPQPMQQQEQQIPMFRDFASI